MIFLFFAIILVSYSLWIIFIPSMWLKAYNFGAKIKFTELISLHIFNVPARPMIDARIKLFKSGIDISITQLRKHYINGGDVNMVIEGLLKAQEKKIKLNFNKACELDLQEKKTLHGDPIKKRADETQKAGLNRRENPLVVSILILGFIGVMTWWYFNF